MRAAYLLAAIAIIGCESEAEKQQHLAQQAAAAEKALFEKRRTELLAAPDRFLETSNFKSFDKGIINSYRQLTDVTVTNRSALPVRVKQARVVWFTDSGQEVGSSPLTMNGILAPGTDKRFSTSDGSMTSGTIQGDASKLKVEFTAVEVVATAQ